METTVLFIAHAHRPVKDVIAVTIATKDMKRPRMGRLEGLGDSQYTKTEQLD